MERISNYKCVAHLFVNLYMLWMLVIKDESISISDIVISL